VAKTTAATLMLLASSPSRLKDLRVARYDRGAATLTWTPSPEKGVTGYVISVGNPDRAASGIVRVSKPPATVRAAPGTMIGVKAVNGRGLEGWDWARVRIESR
jgi:hypothetical protein